MPRHHTTEHSPYAPRQLFELVADIERYPEFLPWCNVARIVERKSDVLLHAELGIRFKQVKESYVSEVTLHPPASGHDTCAIEVIMLRGPFTHLTNHWKFTPTSGGGTQITLELDFAFRSRLLNNLIGPIFGRAAGKMAHAFKERADKRYRQSPASSSS